MSVADRGEPEASRSQWYADGTAGEDDRGSGLAATVPARPMGEARPGRPEPRWQGSNEPRQAPGWLEVLLLALVTVREASMQAGAFR